MKMSKQFPLNALRVFEAVSRHLSFTKAGEELGLTQTAVSYQVKLLEDMLGEALFLRQPRRIHLTEAGSRLAPKVSEGFELLRAAVNEMQGVAEGTLIIHSTHTFASHWLARHLGIFQLDNPTIAVRLETSQQVIDFSKTEADVAIRVGTGEWPGLKSHFVLRNHFTPMLSPTLAETIGGVREPLDLVKLKIIDPSDPWWRIWFTAAGHPDAPLESTSRSRLGSQAVEAAAAIAGHGVAILRPDFYQDDVAMGRLIQPFPLTCEDGSHYWLAYPETRRHVGKIRAFREFLKKTLPSFDTNPTGKTG
ncbi:LysR family transcriptional regulator, glycine cleavage system transcriptional activator [Rhizobium sp. RU35A]|uniref:LysR family transcriptional regulator n=1 Tax=Rhizobium straminoryzae TaxID=1387186 RepID=A0A549TDC7_9HYPH|nr:MULTISPECIES: LysR substrate-binding domain-containing protein [Rhizobium]TRL40050.1 LysR family transcriptional regulator [Rhizobium straminoryzae]SIQ20287.1 LysR family transcriptional regulator, glycine cleavage system transcriptional activator [Rhizobium sp. RU35A]